MNRLQHETSPYLRQHTTNPVHWYPWGEEAFARAQTEDRPIFLSIGYSSCHWCHVMAHESFEDEDTARYLNAHFVSIKVDREERPDVDDIYMRAVQQMTRGHGGWPLSVFLTPGGDPFYGGTYFPLEPRYGMPSFRQILEGVLDAYQNRRGEVNEAGRDLAQSLDLDFSPLAGRREVLVPALLDSATRILIADWDKEHGGFAGAPKFPQPMNLAFLLRSYHRTGDPRALQVVTHSLHRMALGGIYDQVGGGFARYSTDAYWLVPHFEKMLYDNAQLSRLYLHTWQITGDDFFRRVAEDIYDYILREMTAPEGGFYSATDADSEGEEGKFFVWSQAEIETLLGDDAPLLLNYWGVTPGGNFEGRSILYVPREEAGFAHEAGLSVDDLRAKVAAARAKLYAARQRRVPPLLDDKLLTAWNGLMLASLADAARVLGRADYRAAAIKNGDFLLSAMMTPEGRLWRTHRAGQSKLNAYLEDYGGAVEGLLELYQATFDARWFDAARRLADFALEHFAAGDGSFYDTSDDHEALIVRPRNFQDNAMPSGSSLLARGLLRLAAYTAEPHYSAAAEGLLTFLAEMMRRVPQGFGEALGAADLLINPLDEVAVVGDPADERTQALLRVIQGRYRPNVVTALAAQDVAGEHAIPLLSYRSMKGGAPTVYVCRGFACRMPVTRPEEAAALLDGER